MSFWNFYALFYDSLRHLLPYQELVTKTADSALEKECLRVLDAGCGTGNFTEKFFSRAGRSIHCFGIDRSWAMLKRAVRKSKKHPGLSRFAQTDLNSTLPFRDASFDCAVCLNVLYALDNPENVLKEFHRVLKFGGRLILANPRKSPRIRDAFTAHFKMLFSDRFSRAMRGFFKTLLLLPCWTIVILLNLIIKQRAKKKRYHFTDGEELENLLKKNGFRVLSCENAYGGTVLLFVLSKVMPCGDASKPMTLEVAETPEDFEAIYRLRYDIYCEEIHSLDPRDYPDKKETDKYDPYSTHFLLRLDGEIVGTVRVIRETPWGFLVEEEFRLPDDVNRAKTLEPSRLAIKKNHRGRRLLKLLLKAAEMWSLERGYDNWCFAAQDWLADFYESIGWNILRLNSSQNYHNCKVISGIRHL